MENNKPQRKRSKPRSGPGSGKGSQGVSGSKNIFSRLYQTEEGRAKIAAWREKAKKTGTGRKPGQPDGMRKDEFFKTRDRVKEEAKKIVEIMEQKLKIEDTYAKEALETAVEIMRMPAESRSRLAAAKLILEFTKEKPSTKSEVTVAKAEDFLESILKQNDGS